MNLVPVSLNRKLCHTIVVSGFALAFVAASIAADIQIKRVTTTSKATIGNLFVDGIKVCETYELPNAIPYKWVQPAKYSAFVRTDEPKGWRIELKGTDPLKNIQIHRGNSNEDTEGCVLVGFNADSKNGHISNSAKALDALRAAVDRSPIKTITVEFFDAAKN